MTREGAKRHGDPGFGWVPELPSPSERTRPRGRQEEGGMSRRRRDQPLTKQKGKENKRL